MPCSDVHVEWTNAGRQFNWQSANAPRQESSALRTWLLQARLDAAAVGRLNVIAPIELITSLWKSKDGRGTTHIPLVPARIQYGFS